MSELPKLLADWQTAYQEYTSAHDANRYVTAGDPVAAARITPAYRNVARLWRELAAVESTPWWARTAALHAAETFEHQAVVEERAAGGAREVIKGVLRPTGESDRSEVGG
ncbi:hypothetical protein [Actinosynnema sp. NPDC020468]|uniref:hypothetical protein n=1 Tax=Actinosynnema sp. NPDC020468 TaxID=3154488 RepID=UPI00340D8BBB